MPVLIVLLQEKKKVFAEKSLKIKTNIFFFSCIWLNSKIFMYIFLYIKIIFLSYLEKKNTRISQKIS
jgi:hypothetical protein